MIQAEQLHARILEELDLSRDIPDEELTELIHRVLDEASGREYIPLGKKAELGRELFNAFRKFDLLQEFLEDDKITEIMINGTENIFLEKEGKLIRSGKRFVSREKLEDVIQQIVAGSNRIVNEASPIVDARLPDGSRVNVVLGPIALNGPIVTIRKFPKEAITMRQLIRWGSICREVKEFLVKLVRAGYNIFISGGTGSGKTTFLNALSQYIPKDERIITIEDNAELRILDIPNLVTLEARCANLEGTGEITIRELIRTALRMRPNRIIVGEVRGAEAIDMLQALNTGHDGSLSTGHANSPKLVSEGTPVKLTAILTYREDVEKQVLYECMAMVYPRMTGSDGVLLEKVRRTVAEKDQDTRESGTLTLPKQVDGQEIHFYTVMNWRGAVIMVAAVVISVLFFALDKQNEIKEKQARQKQMCLDYPEVISKLTLLLGAGMTVRKAWRKIVNDYDSRIKQQGKRAVYEEMKYTCRQMDGGVPEAECYEKFGRRCGTQEYMRFGALLSQNLRKGTKGLNDMLRLEAIQSFEERKARARRLGEEAGTKLLLPMFLMLAEVLVIVVVPAFFTVQM